LVGKNTKSLKFAYAALRKTIYIDYSVIKIIIMRIPVVHLIPS